MINKLKAFIANARADMAYRAKVRETINELQALTNVELWDIGISRGEIYSIAHGHPKPKKVTAEDFKAEVNENIKGWA